MSLVATLAKLEEAQGDPGKLALATLDIVLESHEPWLREAMEAACVPHWFDQAILAKLLSIDGTTAELYVGRLQRLPMVERFATRDAWNVHEATRLALRARFASDSSDRFRELSARAGDCFTGSESHQIIERIFHRLIAEPTTAERDLDDLWAAWNDSGRHGLLQALVVSVIELLSCSILVPVARGRALLTIGLINFDRLPAADVEKLARESADIFKALGNSRSEMEARALIGDAEFKNGDLERAYFEYDSCRKTALDLTRANPGDPAWERELAVLHNKIGKVYQKQGRRDAALQEFKEFKRAMMSLTGRVSKITAWQRDLSTSQNCIGEIYREENQLQEALDEIEGAKQIMLRLASQDPDNLEWQRDLSLLYFNIGSILQEEGFLNVALTEYRRGLQITKQLAQIDPTNVQWQRDFEIAKERVEYLEPKINVSA